MKGVLLDAPNVGIKEKAYLDRAIKSTYVSTVGPFVPAFEEMFARYLGVKKAVSTQSGTAALHIALYEAGITRGDEVIVPALTFVATINPVFYVGAKPVIVDVNERTWAIDPCKIEQALTPKTKAILPVHLYGNPCEMKTILAIAKKHHLTVIEDATESLGATYAGRHTGTLGDFGCFSFNGNKIITTGGGGMVVAQDARNAAHIKLLVNQARKETREYCYAEVGFNYRMTNLEAALGLAQLKRLSGFLAKKRRFMNIYEEEFEDVPGVRFQESYPMARSSYWFTCIMFEKQIDLTLLQNRLKAQGVPTRRIFKPLSKLPPYKECVLCGCKNAETIYKRGLCLPGSSVNSEASIHKLCRIIKKEIARVI